MIHPARPRNSGFEKCHDNQPFSIADLSRKPGPDLQLDWFPEKAGGGTRRTGVGDSGASRTSRMFHLQRHLKYSTITRYFLDFEHVELHCLSSENT